MESQKSKKFCLETKGVCFFCFHEISRFNDGKLLNESEITQDRRSCNMSLKCLSRYLNVNFEKVFKLNIPFQFNNIVTSDLIVPLCEKCAAVTKNFSKLYSELELVKMHLHSCVCTIREKMVKADFEHDLSEKYKKKWIMNNTIDAIQAEIVNNLRKETKEKCSSKLGTVQPRVKLNKCIEIRPNESEKILNALKRSPDVPSVMENVFIPNKRALIQSGNLNEKSNDLPCSTQSLFLPAAQQNAESIKIISQLPPLQNIVSSTRAVSEAQICRSVPNVPKNTIVLKSPSTVHSSVVGNSSNNSFIPLQSSTVPIVPSRSVQAVPLKSSIGFSYPNQPKRPQRYVPTSSATSVISSPNTTASGSVNINKRNGVNKSTAEKSRQLRSTREAFSQQSYDCVHCEEKFSEKSALRTHVVRSHCEQFFTTLKDRNLSPVEFKSIVYLLFKDVAKSHTIDCSGSTSKNIYSCPYCRMETDTDGDVYAHMFRFHYSDLTSKLLALQKETIVMRGDQVPTSATATVLSQNVNTTVHPFLCECSMRYASKRTLQFHQKYNCKLTKKETVISSIPVSTVMVQGSNAQSNSDSLAVPPTPSTSSRETNFNCSYCGKDFPFYYDHRVHLLTTHRLEEFSKYVSPGVTSSQVNAELQKILQMYQKLPGHDNTGSCLFCTEIFSNVAQLQNHILVGHFDVVVFKLRSIIPHQTLHPPDNLLHIHSHGLEAGPSTTAINSENHGDNGVSASIPVEQNTATLNFNAAEELLMSDPLSLDFIELEPESLFCKEEEHLKMEWLFSFIEEEETQVQPQSQPSIEEDAKDFNTGNNDFELILP